MPASDAVYHGALRSHVPSVTPACEIYIKKLIVLGGAVFVGILYADSERTFGKAVALFNSPVSGSTLGLKLPELVRGGAELVRRKIRESDSLFGVSL